LKNLNLWIAIEKKVVRDCLNDSVFNNDTSQLDLQHLVMKYFDNYQFEDCEMNLSEQRIKDLVNGILEIKEKNRLQRIQERLTAIDKGDREKHEAELKVLKGIYTFTDTDIMKLSCWLTQVKRTAYNLRIECPTALALFSPKKATGKSTFMTLVKRAILSSYQDSPRLKNFGIEDLFTRFRPIELIYDLVITIDEIGWMNKDITAQMKSLITETNEIQIEKKYKDPITARKLANFMITTNDDPADLFYTDAHERRLSVIDKFDKKIDVDHTRLYGHINMIWKTAPIEYMYDTKKLMEINLNRVRSNDEIFEALLEIKENYRVSDYDMKYDSMLDFDTWYTVTKLYRIMRDRHIEVNKKLLRNYMDTTPEYFTKSVSGRTARYKATKKLEDDLNMRENSAHTEE
jgi:hypothetical protein